MIIAGSPSKPIKLAIAKPTKLSTLINKFLRFSFSDRKGLKLKSPKVVGYKEIHSRREALAIAQRLVERNERHFSRQSTSTKIHYTLKGQLLT
ncbi:hypothetical protein [Komarekiella delphini-convector]|uniref:hypothetical protein n=1 Tax=Komarekiella delphini-convector TaxID=3050158 RepID=UPI001CD8CF9F|nr:hypothetical protein [Komarekiella delphini-convector]